MSGRRANAWNEHQRELAGLGLSPEEVRRRYHEKQAANTQHSAPAAPPAARRSAPAARSSQAANAPKNATTSTHARSSNPWNEHQRRSAQLGLSRDEARHNYHAKPPATARSEAPAAPSATSRPAAAPAAPSATSRPAAAPTAKQPTRAARPSTTSTRDRASNPWNEYQRISAQLGFTREETRHNYHATPSANASVGSETKRSALADAAAARAAAAEEKRAADAAIARDEALAREIAMREEHNWRNEVSRPDTVGSSDSEQEELTGWYDNEDVASVITDEGEPASPVGNKIEAPDRHHTVSSPRSVEEIGGLGDRGVAEQKADIGYQAALSLPTAMESGTIRHYHPKARYGFLSCDREWSSSRDETKLIYFHVHDCDSQTVAPRVGESIKFSRDPTSVHPKAMRVVRTDCEPAPETRPSGPEDYATMIALLSGYGGSYYIPIATKMLEDSAGWASGVDAQSLRSADPETQVLLLTIALTDAMDAATQRGLLAGASGDVNDQARFF